MYSIIISIVLSLFFHTVYADKTSHLDFSFIEAKDPKIEKIIERLLAPENLRSTFKEFLKNGTSYEDHILRHKRIKRSKQFPISPDIYPFKQNMTVRDYRSFWNAFADKLLEAQLITRLEFFAIQYVFEDLAESHLHSEIFAYIHHDLERIELMENLYWSHKNILTNKKR